MNDIVHQFFFHWRMKKKNIAKIWHAIKNDFRFTSDFLTMKLILIW